MSSSDDQRAHWEQVWASNEPDHLSWFQADPEP